MASELAKAYVQIIPTAKGISGSLSNLLGGEAESAGKKSGSIFSKALGDAIKVAAAGVAAAAAGMVKVGKDAIAGFADYEQLVGGVETLFKDSADVVQGYAADAFKTAGLSANQYMETVTGFSASLLQSLDGDTAKAAEIGDMAIRDMADNANKMGSSMESIQNAYQGFAKQNYTMLDNLKLGYGGTKQEMERLLQDATALSGIEYDIDSLSDVYEAIHVIQSELGITGTTAKEASETISGSLTSMKGAWDNLLVGVANDNADITALVDSFVDSAVGASKNVIPRINVVLSGIGNLLPEVVMQLAPLGAQMIGALSEGLISNLPALIESSLQIVSYLAKSIAANIPELIPTVMDIVFEIVDTLTNPDTLSTLIDASLAIMLVLANGLIDAVPKLIEKAPEIIDNLVVAVMANFPKVIETGVRLVYSIIEGIVKTIPTLALQVPRLVLTVIDGILNNLQGVLDAGKSIVDSVKNGFSQKVQDAKTWGRDLIANFIQGIKDKLGELKSTVSNIAQTVKSYLGFSEPEQGPLSNFHTYAPDMMKLFSQGIRDNLDLVRDAANNAAAVTRMELAAPVSRVDTAPRSSSVVVNVYGAEGQSADDIARKVVRLITQQVQAKEAAWA